jgi:hypothetical protein
MKTEKDFQYYLEFVELGHSLQKVPDKYRYDYELCLKAVRGRGTNLKHVPDNNKNDLMCLEAIRQDPQAFWYIPLYRVTLEMAREAIREFGHRQWK